MDRIWKSRLQDLDSCIETCREIRLEVRSLIDRIHRQVKRSKDICARDHELLNEVEGSPPDQVTLADGVCVGETNLPTYNLPTTVEENEAVGIILEMDFLAGTLDEPTPADSTNIYNISEINETCYNGEDNSEGWISEQSSEHGDSTVETVVCVGRESADKFIELKRGSYLPDVQDEQTREESSSHYVGSPVESDTLDSFRELLENGDLDDVQCEPFIEDSMNIDFKYEMQNYFEQSSKEINHSEAAVGLMKTLKQSFLNDFDVENLGADIESVENIEFVEKIIEQEALLYDEQSQEENIKFMGLSKIDESYVNRKTVKPINILERNVDDILNIANIVPDIQGPSQSVMLGGAGGGDFLTSKADDLQINESNDLYLDVFEALNGIRELIVNGYLDDIQGIQNLGEIATNCNIEDYVDNQDSDEIVIIDVKPECIDKNQQDESALEGSESTDDTIELVELLLDKIDFDQIFESSDIVHEEFYQGNEIVEGFKNYDFTVEEFKKHCWDKNIEEAVPIQFKNNLTFDNNIKSSNKEFGSEKIQKRLELPKEVHDGNDGTE